MNIFSRKLDNCLVVSFDMKLLNASAARYFRSNKSILKQLSTTATLVVDLEHVIIADSSGIAVIVDIYQRQPPGSKLFILNANLAIKVLLEDTLLDQLFPTIESLEDVSEPERGALTSVSSKDMESS